MSDKIMSERDWYREAIAKMLNSIQSENQLLKIYSFTKVFADDWEERNESRSR